MEKAFDVEALKKSQSEKGREKLDVHVLHKRINWEKLDETLSAHVLRVLVAEVEILGEEKKFVDLRFRTTLAIHRMREGRKTSIHPLATSDHDEGKTEENAFVLDDLVSQIGLTKEETNRLLILVGSDQSTVEKIRTLKKFLASCTHGYKQYGWVLPLIQLWHMGWADLERVLNTHWGPEAGDDVSTFCHANVLLGRKVKDVTRPDYYPAQHLVFDTLKTEILDCWRSVWVILMIDANSR